MNYKSPRALYNAIGKDYHDNREKASNDFSELPIVLELLGPDIKNKQVLDMGCGLGVHAKEFIKRGAIVTGYDASEKMIAYTKSLCGDKGTFFRATHETVTFPENTFDIINASYTIPYSKQLDYLFEQVNLWLKKDGIFTFSVPHPVWLFSHVENMDYSKDYKVTIKIKSYNVELFNYYYPLDTYIQLINKHNFRLLHIKETPVLRKYKGWPKEKYQIPIAFLFKLQKI